MIVITETTETGTAVMRETPEIDATIVTNASLVTSASEIKRGRSAKPNNKRSGRLARRNVRGVTRNTRSGKSRGRGTLRIGAAL